jgi:hypothetical protein
MTSTRFYAFTIGVTTRPGRVVDRLSEAVEYAVDSFASAGQVDLTANGA